MPVMPPDTILTFLMWACGVLGSGLIASLIFIAIGVMSKLDKLDASNKQQFDQMRLEAQNQYASFGKQLTHVHDLVIEDIHKHDVRIVKLEEWRLSLAASHIKGAVPPP